MNLFCFASRDEINIRLGVHHKKWAVAKVSDSFMRVRLGRANKHFKVGSLGLLYCTPRHAFTTPFIVESEVDPYAVETNIWPTAWVFPFDIRPLGDLSRSIRADAARLRWPVVQRRWPPIGGVSAAMNLTGLAAFAPVPITEDDWKLILDDLAT